MESKVIAWAIAIFTVASVFNMAFFVLGFYVGRRK